MAEVEHESVRIECPRCGYSLRGHSDGWSDVCPLDGTCSECGLAYRWRDILNPRFATPAWCVEFSQGAARVVLTLAKTLAMMMRPWRFWGELRLQHPIHARRLALFAAALPFVAFLFFSISVGCGTGTYNRMMPGLPQSHLMVAGFLHGCFAPFSSTRSATTIAPASLSKRYEVNLIENTLRAVRTGTDEWTAGNRDWLCSLRVSQGFCTVLLCPIGFVALPISRRKSKVRWSHVFRVGTYGLAFLLIPLTFDFWSQMSIFVDWSTKVTASLMMTGVLGAALVIWWSVATSQYLCMPHAWLVGAAVVTLAYLLQWLLMASIDFGIDVIDLL